MRAIVFASRWVVPFHAKPGVSCARYLAKIPDGANSFIVRQAVANFQLSGHYFIVDKPNLVIPGTGCQDEINAV
jgi:hypothetical protein